MKVMVIVKASPSSEAGEMPDEQLLADMGKYNEELANAGIMLAGEGLHPSSKGARVRFSGKNRTVIDGPFAETKELIAGFWMWKVKSMEEAIDWIKKCPNPMKEDSEIEIRPVFEADDFGDAFTPELREQEAAIRAQTLGLIAPRFEEADEMTIAGFNERYTLDSRIGIPKQWEQFAPRIGHVPGQVGKASYGVCWNMSEGGRFNYLTGVEISNGTKTPNEYIQLTIPSSRYAVFTHRGHVSGIDKTMDKIWSQWLPESGLKAANTLTFERYGDTFDPSTLTGDVEIWVPLEST